MATAKKKHKRNPHRGIVLALHDAAAIHRMLEYWYLDRRWFNPIEAIEAKKAGYVAMARLGEKLITVFAVHEEPEATNAYRSASRRLTPRDRKGIFCV